MEMIDIIEKLVGEINPIGASHVDDKRLDNLKVFIDIAKDMHSKIYDIYNDNVNRQEFSMKKASDEAGNYLDWVEAEDD